MQTFRITNLGRSPRGIHDAKGRVVTINPNETREVSLNDASVMRYRQKIAGGDTLEMVAPLSYGDPRPAPKALAPAPAPAPADAAPKKRGRKSNAEKEAAAAAAASQATRLPEPDPVADMRSEAIALGLPAAEVAKWGTKRLKREIEGAKLAQGK